MQYLVTQTGFNIIEGGGQEDDATDERALNVTRWAILASFPWYRENLRAAIKELEVKKRVVKDQERVGELLDKGIEGILANGDNTLERLCRMEEAIQGNEDPEMEFESLTEGLETLTICNTISGTLVGRLWTRWRKGFGNNLAPGVKTNNK